MASDLRTELHRAVDRVLDEYLSLEPTAAAQSGSGSASGSTVVVRINEGKDWEWMWPGGAEVYPRYADFTIDGDFGLAQVRVAWTTRAAWGKPDRGRAVVFGSIDGKPYYPFVEFTEADQARMYCAVIPDVASPRRSLREDDPLPPRFSAENVSRADELFLSIANGSTLRYVVPESDEEEMVKHGYWVAALRGKI